GPPLQYVPNYLNHHDETIFQTMGAFGCGGAAAGATNLRADHDGTGQQTWPTNPQHALRSILRRHQLRRGRWALPRTNQEPIIRIPQPDDGLETARPPGAEGTALHLRSGLDKRHAKLSLPAHQNTHRQQRL